MPGQESIALRRERLATGDDQLLTCGGRDSTTLPGSKLREYAAHASHGRVAVSRVGDGGIFFVMLVVVFRSMHRVERMIARSHTGNVVGRSHGMTEMDIQYLSKNRTNGTGIGMLNYSSVS